jgi:hypothetical protein
MEENNKAFHQKMLRRRITTMLRPNVRMMLDDVRRLIQSSECLPPTMKDRFDVVTDNDESLCRALRLEQLLLLALHPTSPSPPLSPVPGPPTSDQSWAEPGWQLIIDNPGLSTNRIPSPLLPIDDEGRLSQKFLSICCSSGRQAASLIKPRHLRLLSSPSSTSSQTSAHAETNTLLQNKSSEGTVTLLDHYSFLVFRIF